MTRDSSDGTTPPGTLRVLVVEDNDDHFELTNRLLRTTGDAFRTQTLRAATLASAAERLKTEPFDIVLLDLGLPDSEPESTLGEVLSVHPEVAVLVLTSLSDEKLGQYAVREGAQDYLTKGEIDADDLRRAIVHAIERKRNEVDLARSNAELKRFAHTVAHEIRTPAAAAIMGIDAFREMRSTDPEVAAEMLDQASGSLRGLLSLVKEMLQFAELEEGGGVDEPVPLGPLCETILEQFRSLLLDAKTEVHLDQLPTVTGNVTHLTQLFQNLIGNAIKYRSTRPLRITIESAGNEVRVCDNGLGIAESHWDRVFNMFHRVEQRTDVEGTGVGLAICRNVMNRMGGSIRVTSTEGEGSCFILTFDEASIVRSGELATA